jgi:soluble lytic murein transglycosylase-like protein
MSDRALWVMLGGAALVAWLYTQREGVSDVIQSGVDNVQAAVSGWQTVKDGPLWVPLINTAENQRGIPQNLLARMAYQESHFRPEIIDGSLASSAGALGILQLMPQYFATVRVARPFTAQDTAAQIQEAAGELARLYQHYRDWGLAVAGYNDGQGNVDRYVAGNRALPAKTVTYVSDVLTDVPVAGASVPA